MKSRGAARAGGSLRRSVEPPLVVLLAGGQGERLGILSEERAKPAVPFGGRYRIIDFALSNCVNSGFYDVLVLAQYRPRSLDEHIGVGKPWDLDRARGGIEILQPYPGQVGSDWYRGTADAVCHNFQSILEKPSTRVLVLCGDHVYKMDYRQMVAFHQDRRADVTIATVPVGKTVARQMGVLSADETGRVVDFEEKPETPAGSLASMGVYLFEIPFLRDILQWDSPQEWPVDFGRDVIPAILRDHGVYAFPFDGYWLDIGTIDSYYQANMDLLSETPQLDLLDADWVIFTNEEGGPPARVDAGAEVESSLMAHGCVVGGRVARSILFPGVHVGEGARVEDSIVMTGCQIGPAAIVRRAILDKQVRVGERVSVGSEKAKRANRLFPEHLSSGLTLVGKRSVLPAGVRVGGNCLVGPKVGPSLWREVHHLTDGETLTRSQPLSA